MIDDASVEPEMSDAEVVAHLRAWVAEDRVRTHGPFAWPTDACGYHQHLRFVDHRNACLEAGVWSWDGHSREDWRVFVLAYADRLEATLPCPCGGAHAADAHDAAMEEA